MSLKMSLVFMVLIVNVLRFGFSFFVNDISILLNRFSTDIFIHSYMCDDIESRLSMYKSLWEKHHVRISEITNEIDIPSPLLAHQSLFIVDIECPEAQNILNKAEEKKLFGSPYKWLIKMPQFKDDPNDSLKSMLNYSWLPDSDINIYMESYENQSYIFNVYRATNTSDWLMEKFDENEKIITAINRRDVGMANIHICYVLTSNDSLNHLSDYLNREVDTITKVSYVLTGHIVHWMNGTRISSFTSTWGYKDDTTGQWSGMLGYLTTFNADIGGSPLFLTADRVPVIDYIAMPTPTRSKFVFRQPKLSYTSNVFLLPFRTSVWNSSIALLIVLSIILLLVSYWEGRRYRGGEILEPGISDVILVTIGAMCQQGSSVLLKGIVGRLILLLLFMSLMFLYTSYSANIVALLQSSSSRIRNLQDLLNSRLKFGVHDTVFNRHYFSTASEPIRKAIYERKVAPPGTAAHFISLQEGVDKLRKGLYAFHMEIGVGYKVVEETFHEGEKCGLQEIQYLQVVDPWLAVQKNSSLKEIFKLGFRRIHQFGLQNRENSLLYTAKPRCTLSGSNFVSVGLIDTKPAFLALLWGLLAAITIFIVEFTYFYFYARYKKHD